VEQVDQTRREQKQAEGRTKKEQRMDDLRWILRDPRGRRYMKGMLTFHAVFAHIPTNNKDEMMKTLGKHEAGKKIYGEIFEANQGLALEMFGELI
jgi:hypothetical protein